MEELNAVRALGALAQESRLKIFRLLVQCGPDGMAAGDIARRLKLPQNTLSFHVAILVRARLVASRKVGRSIIYSVDLEGTRDLLSFLVEVLWREGRALRAPDCVCPGMLLSCVRRRTVMQVVSSTRL
jgi:ArsR family transcriptional regulator, arsenate/arsenite/antimonite-responsive transcriptional repressor